MRARLIATLVLALIGLALCLIADPSAIGTWTFFAAALAALGTRLGVVFGALTLVAAMGLEPRALPLVAAMPLIGGVLAGAALGLLGRELERHLDWLVREHRPVVVALAALSVVLTFVLPDPAVRLVSDGLPATFNALTIDPGTAMHLWRPIPALVTYLAPLADLELFVLVLAGMLTFGALAHAALRLPLDRVFLWIARATAAVAGLVALIALLDLLVGQAPLDAEALRRALTHRASHAGPLLDLAVPAAGELRLWSRPLVDGLRLIAALMLAWAPFMNAHSQTAAPERPWLLLALATAVIALPFAPLPMALAGGVTVGLGALVAGRSGSPSDLAPRIALVMVLTLWVWSALARAPLG